MKDNEIWLGNGEHIITDITAKDGSWSGIAVCESPEPVGIGDEVKLPIDEFTTLSDLNARVVIVSPKVESLDVLINAATRAKEKLRG